jgi:hypothetical protein
VVIQQAILGLRNYESLGIALRPRDAEPLAIATKPHPKELDLRAVNATNIQGRYPDRKGNDQREVQ